MQTPLAAIQSRLELMVQEKGLPEAQVRNIRSIGQSVIRMNRLNKGLLLLAKIENKQFKDIQSFEVQPIIERILERSGSPLELKHLNVTCSWQKITINSNIVLVDILLSNLIRNAIEHSVDGGYIKIFSGNGNVEISNAGEPLSFPKEYLFHRFQKGNLSKTSEGNGLGLAIVKQICDTCNFDISYHYEDGMHLFRIKFRQSF